MNYVLLRIGFKSGIKRRIENPEDEDVNEQRCKHRRIEKPEVQCLFTSEQFLRPSPSWKMPKKRPMISCRQQQQRHFDALRPPLYRIGPQPGCSWFETCKENVIEVPDDEDTAVLGVWQDANTLRKCPVFKAASNTKKTTGATLVDLSADDDDAGDNDVQVIKVVESHSSEIARSGNTLSIFQTPSTRLPVLPRHFAADSGNLKKSAGLLQHMISTRSSSSEDGNGSHSGTLSTSNRAEEKKPKLALYESFKVEEKKQYLELLQQFTDVPLEAQNRHPRSIWNTCGKTIPQRGESLRSFDYAGSAREKLSPIFIDLTKPQRCRSVSRKRIEVCRDREAEPYTAASKQEEDVSQTLQFPFTRTNSLADSFKSNFFCREDLLTSINEKYRRKREAREKQEDEEKLKVSHFQEREKKLHEEALERMTKYLKITDAILDEVTDEEEVPLPELTPEMQDVIDAALIPRPPNEVLVEAFGLSIKRHDMQTLADLNWLNDEVINFYMELLKKRGKLANYPTVYTFNTFFYPKLLSGGHTALKRWTRKIDIFSHDLIIVPVHLRVHWCLAVIDFRNKTLKYYDSMGSPNNKCLENLMKYLQDESLEKKKMAFDTSGWQTENVQKIPQQMNGSDCGMFACTFAEYICRGAGITFTQQDMPYFRRKMVYEIYNCELL